MKSTPRLVPATLMLCLALGGLLLSVVPLQAQFGMGKGTNTINIPYLGPMYIGQLPVNLNAAPGVPRGLFSTTPMVSPFGSYYMGGRLPYSAGYSPYMAPSSLYSQGYPPFSPPYQQYPPSYPSYAQAPYPQSFQPAPQVYLVMMPGMPSPSQGLSSYSQGYPPTQQGYSPHPQGYAPHPQGNPPPAAPVVPPQSPPAAHSPPAPPASPAPTTPVDPSTIPPRLLAAQDKVLDAWKKNGSLGPPTPDDIAKLRSINNLGLLNNMIGFGRMQSAISWHDLLYNTK